MKDAPGDTPLIDFEGISSGTNPTLQLVLGIGLMSGPAVLQGMLNFERTESSSMTPPLWRLMNTAFLGVEVLGLIIACFAVHFLTKERNFKRALEAGAPDAWTLDYDWTPGRSSDGARKAAALSSFKGLFGAAYAVFMVGFVGLYARSAELGLAGDLLFMAAAALAYFALWLFYWPPIKKALRQGDSLLLWDGPTPIPHGVDWFGRAEVALRLEAPRACLRYVLERPVMPVGDDASQTRIERHELERIPVYAAASPRAGGGTTVILRFKTEPGAPASAWSLYPSRYWELALADEKAGFSTAFPLPLY